MKKVLIGVGIALFFGLSVGMFINQPKRISNRINDEKFDKIMDQDFNYDYPETYVDVVTKFLDIEKLMFNQDYKGKRAERKEEMVLKALELWDDQLISQNGGIEKVTVDYLSDIDKFQEGKYKIMDYEYQASPQKSVDNDGNLVMAVNVIEYISIGDNAYKMFLLRKDDNKNWKICGITKIEPFKIAK